MNKTLNKLFAYNGYLFNIKVDLEDKIEKKLNGRVWHTVTVNDTGASNYYQRFEVEDDELHTAITCCQEKCIAFVDNATNRTKAEKILNNLGFK
jgi:hypothetical protein